MQQIVIINGPAGVGKTSISLLLAKDYENSVAISGDSLRQFIINKSPSVKGRLGYKNGASLIDNFIAAGYELVVFEYIFPSIKQIQYLQNNLETQVPVIVITLWAELAVLKAREAARKNREPLKERVEQCYAELKSNYGDFENLLHTDELKREEVVDQIKYILGVTI